MLVCSWNYRVQIEWGEKRKIELSDEKCTSLKQSWESRELSLSRFQFSLFILLGFARFELTDSGQPVISQYLEATKWLVLCQTTHTLSTQVAPLDLDSLINQITCNARRGN